MKTTTFRPALLMPLWLAAQALLPACGTASTADDGNRRDGSALAPANLEHTEVHTDVHTYVLTLGASVLLAAPGTPSLKLERINDSRCRAGAVCVWAGYISYSFALTSADGSTSNFILSEQMPNASASVTTLGLTFTLTGLEPQAVPAKNAAAPDYRVSLRVSPAPPS